jgi:hypothetical protein
MKIEFFQYGPGWYWIQPEDKFSQTVGTINQEDDRRWHVYIKRDTPPGDFRFKTLWEAKAFCRRYFKNRKVNEK